jgi:hypothetical protein
LPRDCGSQVAAILTVKVPRSLRPGVDSCSLTSEQDYLKVNVRPFERTQGRRGPAVEGEKGNFLNRTCKESSLMRQPHLMILHHSEPWYVQRPPRGMIEAGSDCARSHDKFNSPQVRAGSSSSIPFTKNPLDPDCQHDCLQPVNLAVDNGKFASRSYCWMLAQLQSALAGALLPDDLGSLRESRIIVGFAQ